MTAADVATLTVSLTGPFRVSTGGGAPALPKGRKARGILAYLLFHQGKPISRSKLIDLFWSDRGVKQGQASLRQALHEIRARFDQLSVSELEISREFLRISPNNSDIDIWDDEGRIVTGLTEPLLDGLDPVAPVFDEWLEEARRVMAATQLRQAESDLSDAEQGSDMRLVAESARIVLDHDPANEPASRSLMSAQSDLGKLSAVKAEFERLARALAEDEFEMEPATQELYETLRHPSQAAHPPVQAVVRRGQRLPTLAVARGAENSSSAQDVFLADALAEECFLRLSTLPELRVVDIDAVAPETPNWNYILRCRVMPHESKIHCVLRLSDARRDIVQWTNRETLDADRFHEQISALADRGVAGVLSAVERNEMRQMPQLAEDEFSAYDHYLKAKFLFYRAESDDYIERVQGELEHAIAKDPQFIPAYTHLIQCYNTASFMTHPGRTMRAGRQRALELAEKLLSIDSSHANSHIAMAWCQIWRQNFAAAERSIGTAIDIGAYEAHRLNAIGTALVYLGRHDEAERFYDGSQARMMHELDYQRTDYGVLYYFKSDYEQALSWMGYGERRLRFRTLFWRALVLAQMGRLSEALEDVDRLTRDVAKNWSGPQPCTAESAIQWYLGLVSLKRQIDQDLLHDGLAKLGHAL